MYKDIEKDVYAILTGTGYDVWPEGKFVDSEASIPCVTYIKLIDNKQAWGDTQTFNTARFTVKVWATDMAELSDMAFTIKKAARAAGFYQIDEGQDITQDGLTQRPLTMTCLVRGKEI